ncbi:hypothetical protein EPO05_07400, partial [Patescibacteria group bacterium]
MLNIYIPNTSKQAIGGGWTFLDNFKKGIAGKEAQIVNTWQECDVVFIIGATMTDRTEVELAKKAGKKIVFRIDNMPKDSRNRGTAFSRMRDFALLADEIIFQSEWAKVYVGDYLKFELKAPAMLNPQIVYNGVDTSVFNFNDHPQDRGEKYLYIQFNRDENKRFPEVAYDFYVKNFKARNQDLVIPELFLIGQFSPELVGANFDFFNKEVVHYTPPIADREALANMYRTCQFLYFPAFADASPNTISEAMACGCTPILTNVIGGTREV